MPYKTILTILSAGPNPLRGLNAAISKAISWDAHLEVLCVGIDAALHSYSYAEISPTLMQGTVVEAQAAARALSQEAKTELNRQGMQRFTITPIVTQAGLLPGVIRRHARFCDLVVTPRPYGDDAGPDAPSLVEAALFEAGVPVLIVPDGIDAWTTPRRIAVAWNESDEALAAVNRALPILVEAETTFITIIDPPQHGPDRSDPGGLLAQYLARHGVRCEVDVLARSMNRISDHLIRVSTDRDIDLIVMGAYGRARWSEAMFGGATRDMLEQCTVPVFLAR
ncbi:universal stress protein [uncultured Tateyamaria sp.]|uniref:universal stress protein n=1 Tax=Tateyamaria sp. 1078 TaxID=3417464 RepID=UPI00261843CE|nr:universal stress protein [uncultured Tateyamaria sp.]